MVLLRKGEEKAEGCLATNQAEGVGLNAAPTLERRAEEVRFPGDRRLSAA
jgi:hypothetical protein